MEKTKKELELRHIAAILFAALAVSQILGNVLYIPAMANTNFLFALLFIGGYGCIAYCLYTGRRDKVLALGFGLVAIPKVLTFLSGWFTELYTVSHWYSGMRFSLLSAVPTLLDTLGYVAACVVAFALLTEYLPKQKELALKIWFVPAISILATFVTALIFYIFCAIGIVSGWWYYAGMYLGFIQLVGRIICAAAFFLGMSWIVNPEGTPVSFALPKKSDETTDENAVVAKPVVEDAAYCGLFKHVLLSMLTLGIWPLIWIYRRTGLLNCVEDEPKQTPLYQLLLCLFVPFYNVYWIYKNALRLEKYAQAKGVDCEISTLCLITSLTGPIIPTTLMQEKINTCIAPVEETEADETQEALPEKAQVGLVKHTLLMILTCGIWHFIWIYRTTKALNVVQGEEERNPVTKLLLCMFVPFYLVYWYYLSAQRIDTLAKRKGVKSELATWTLILSIFMPVVPAILMQEKMNKLV